MGKDRQFADIDIGLGLFQTSGLAEGTFVDWSAVVHAGYRFQTKHFLWKLGVGYPETLYMGIGICF